jgi:acetylornithine deacetylase/succinyl-diaminopimelate desuccinylase-like protein
MHSQLGDEALKHLQALLELDTTNPPGNETIAAEYLADLFTREKLPPVLVGATPDRKNVVARLHGTGEKKPLLLGAHLDVVPAEPESWRHPPFCGEIHDGYLWGRGAIDMKHMAAMSALVLIQLKREGLKLKRDLIFAGVADEEAGCDAGSKFLVENHPDLVKAEFALGEAGAFTVWLEGKPFYPIQVAEKGVVWMKLRARGKPGHGSLPKEGNAVTRLSQAIAKLGSTRLPIHKTAAQERYLKIVASTQKWPRSMLIRNIFNPTIANMILKKIPDRGAAAAMAAGLSNTAVPTVLRAGSKINVVPGFAEAEVDGRSLPGQTTQMLVDEVRRVIGEDIEIEVVRELPPVEHSPESELWDLMKGAIERHHAGAIVMPYLAPGFTDAKNWSRLGTRCYGFMPLQFPDDGVKFADLFHGHDERIPVEGFKWGTQVLYEVVKAFCA